MEHMKRKYVSPAEAKKRKRARARTKARELALSLPITIEQVIAFDCKIVPVMHGYGECWLHLSKSSSGETGSYGQMQHNGQTIGSHRFALAVKLGCTLSDLKGFDASHAPLTICMGGRCCNPAHLEKKQETANRSRDRIRDGVSGHKRPRPELFPIVFPLGVPPDHGDLRRQETCRSDVRPRLLQFVTKMEVSPRQ
jgi:hypothetical protein